MFSGNITASGVTAAQTQTNVHALGLMFTVSAVPVGGAPTLDVYLQTSFDQGTTWTDVAHFAQVTTGTGTWFVRVSGLAAGPVTAVAQSDAALAANTVNQGPFGDNLRLKYVFAAGGSTGPYTVAVKLGLK